MTAYRASRRERAASALGVVALYAALLVAFAIWRSPPSAIDREAGLAVFDISEAPPPPPDPVPPRARSAASKAAPPARHAVPKPEVVPPAEVPQPPTISAPTVAATGPNPTAGTAQTGPGTGARGTGEGLGSGGNGLGGGGGSGAQLIRGAIVDRDYPGDARRAKLGGSVTIRFVVGTDGRVRDCTVVRSSGVASLDATTCRLVEKRFRYAPARNAAGDPIAEERGWRQDWWFDGATTVPAG